MPLYLIEVGSLPSGESGVLLMWPKDRMQLLRLVVGRPRDWGRGAFGRSYPDSHVLSHS
jgi:hypothetical protein